MSDKILNNVWNQLTKDELTDSDFETWKSNIVGDEEVQANVHEYLTDKELTSSDLNSWKSNLGLIEQDPEPKKEKDTATKDAVVVSNQVEVSGDMDSASEGTSLELQEVGEDLFNINSDIKPSGGFDPIIESVQRQENKNQALAATQSIQNDIDNISNQETVAAGANIYFGNLKQRNDTYSVQGSPAVLNAGPTVGFKKSFNSDQEYEDYLKETLGPKYNQYLNYQETGEIKPIDSNNEKQLQQIYDDAEIEIGRNIVKNSLFNVPENVQEYMSFSTDFASGAETEEAQKFLLDDMRSQIGSNKESYDESLKIWKEKGVPLKEELTSIRNDIENFDFNYIGASKDQVNKYNSLIDDYKIKLQSWEEQGFNELPAFVNSTAKLINEQQEGYSEMLRDTRKELISTEVYTEALLKDYSATSRVARSFDEFFAQSFANFAALTSEVVLESAKLVGESSPMSPLGFLAMPEYSDKVDSVISSIQKTNKNYNLEMASKREKLPEAPTLDDVESGQVSIWDYISVSLQDNSATIATTVVPGLASLRGASLVNKARATGVGLKNALQGQKKLWLGAKRTVQGTFFVGETGGKFGDIQTDEAMREQEINLLRSQLRNTESLEDKTNIYNRIQELEEVEDYSLMQKAFTSFGAGATATYFESQGTLKLLEPAKNLAKKIGVNAAKKELYKSKSRFGLNVLGKTISGLKNLPKQVSTEILEESLTLASHNALDILVLGENKSVFEGMNKDFFANVAISSIGIMAPKTAGNTINIIKSEFRTKSEILKNQGLAGRLIKLNESTTSENSKDLREEKREILNELGLSDAISLHKLRYMSNDQILEVADLNRQMRELLKKSSQLGGQGDVSSNETKDLKKKLEGEYTRLAVARQELLDSKERSNKKKAAKIAQVMESGSNNPDAAYWYGVNDFYNDLAMTQMGDGDFISIEGEIQEDGTIKYDNLDEQLAKYKDVTVKDEDGNNVNALEYLKTMTEEGYFNATKIGKDIIVNQAVIDRLIHRASNRSAAHYAAIAPLEELFHLSVASQGIKFDESASNAVEEASEVLEQKKDLGRISEEDYNNLMKRFDLYRNGEDFDVEEFIAQINNAVALGVISRSDIESMYSFRDFINNTKKKVFGSMGWILPIENANDVFNLVRNFKKDINRGVVFQAPGEKEEIKKSLSEELEQKLEELEDRYYDGEIDEYQFEQAKDKLDKEIAVAEKAAKVVDQKVDTEVKPVEEVEKVDKIVKKATTEVFEAKEVSDKNKQIAQINEDIVKEMTDLGANRVSEIQDVEAKKAIVDKLGENNIGAVTELAKKAAATSRDLPIDKNLKVGYEEFFLGFSEELSALINSYKANVDGKQVPFGAYMNQNLRLRYGSILDRSLKGKLKGSESLSSDKNVKKEVGSFVEESSSESTSRDEGRVLEQIDVRKFGPAKDKAGQISDIVTIEQGQKPTYKELTEEFIDPVSVELFDVPGKKIQGKATLSDAEAKSLQRLFVSPDSVRKLIKTMPPYNVAGSETTIGERAENIDVSKDVKGRSIGLSNKFIKQFYQPVTRAIPGISSPKGRSLGLTSQGQVYELKPEFKGRVSNEAVKQIQNSVGVTEAGVPNEKISAANRTKYGTTLTGFAKTYIANVINVTGRSKQTDKQEQADTGAGKASIMFSKSFNLGLENGSNVDNIVSVLFSKSARKNYEQALRAKRPELKDIPEQVDNLIKWADSLDIKDNKKAKYKKLGLFYMANGYAIFPEDGYKIEESIRLAAINKIDPYSFKNPNELIEKYEKVTKIARIDPDSVSEFSNKEEIAGYTIYDVQDSKKGQEVVRKIVDSNWGEKSNPWCLIARNESNYLGHEEAYSEEEVRDIIATNEELGNTVERAGDYMSNGKKVYELIIYAPATGGELAGSFNLWKSYNENGNGFKISFKNGKLNSFRDGNDMQWWDRMDKPQKGPALKIKADSNGLVAEGYFDLKNGAEVIEGYKKDYKKGDLTIEESYTKDKKLVEKYTFGKNKFSNKSLIAKYSFEELDGNDYIETESKYEQDNSEIINTTRKLDNLHKKTLRKKYYDKNGNIIDEVKEKDILTGVITEEIIFTDNNTDLGTFDVYKAETINGKKKVLIDARKRFIYSDNPSSNNIVSFSKSLNIEKLLTQDFISQKPGEVSARKQNSYARIIKDLLEYGGVNGAESFETAVELGNYTKDQLDLINFVFEGRDWLFGIFQDEKTLNQGLKLEKLVKVAIKKLGLKDVSLDLSEGGFSSGVDIVLSVKDKKLNIELKLNEKARVGSFTIKRNGDVFSYTKGVEGIETKLPALHEAIQEQLKGDKYQKAWKKYTEEGMKIGKELLESGKVDIETYVNEETGQLVGPKEVFDYLKDPKKGNYQKDLTIKINQINGKPIDQKIIELLYNNKGVSDINFGGVGMFALGESISGRPELDANVEVRIVTSRASSNGIYRSIQRATPFILDINNTTDLDLADLSKVQPNIEKLVESMSDKSSDISFSKVSNLDKAFNDIIENKTGIPSAQRFGIVEATTRGAGKGRLNFIIPPSQEDFVGLLYTTLGKGKVGDSQMQWYKDNLISPYAKAMNKLSKARVYMLNNYKALKNQLDVVPKDLAKKVEGTDYTKEMAVRVYIWNKQKMEVPGISKSDVKKLSNFIVGNENLQTFADQLINLQLGDGYVKPKEGWAAGTITTDILEGLNTTKRSKYLKEWQENADAIFSEDNMNKLQAAYGLNYVKAMKNMLGRMKSGRNRSFPGDSATGKFTDWVTGSVGVTMFLNTRSAVLQTISAINFINFKDNNILAAGKAFANQPQYWKDFMTLMNSDFLKERRGGLRINVSEADIAEMAKKDGAKGAISKLLQLGFAPTQIADSFAIASGGSTFYRNRINTYKKQGLSDKQAEKKAFEDFRETAEESQQSSRADRISMQQASPVGRFVLAFANTPAQYARIIKKAASDLKNGRGDAKTNISKIIYYGALQNLLFNALQQALFATAFSDEEPEDKEKEKKYLDIANGMMDSLLRGTGIGGAVVSVGKNAIIKLLKELEKDRPKMQNVATELLRISPPVSAKYSRLVQAGKSYDWNKQEMIDKGSSLDNPAYLAAGNVVSSLTNIPLDRAIKKANNVVQATTQDLQTWERIALIGGWQDWELGIKDRDKAQQKRLKQEKKKRNKGVRFKQRKIKIR